MSRSTNLKGLEIAQTFCEKWVVPFLRREFPEISERTACVLFGGSQSLGNDDERSRDHGWGPAFDLFLQSGDAKKSAKRVQQAINTSAPKEWLGARWSLVRGANVKVRSLDAWLNNLIASDDLNDQAKIVKRICRDVFSRLANKGLVTGNPEDDDHCLKIAKQDLRTLMA